MLGPGVNLARVPVGGRNFEYLGEDPILAGLMAAAEVKGIQSEGVVACVKHWADNNQEGPGHNGRLITSSVVSDRANYELYFEPFRAAAAAGAGSIMCSCKRCLSMLLASPHLTLQCADRIGHTGHAAPDPHHARCPHADNLINSTYSCQNEVYLTEHLKGRLGFKGWVVSDWGADHSSIDSINAGMDQTMPGDLSGGGNKSATRAAILQGAIPLARIEDALMRILTPLFSVGVFDRSDYGNTSTDVRSPAHDDLNLQFAQSSTVLLKNSGGILPLSPSATYKLGVVGDAVNVKGGGSGSVWSSHIITPTEGIVDRLVAGAPHPAIAAMASAMPVATPAPRSPRPQWHRRADVAPESAEASCRDPPNGDGVTVCDYEINYTSCGMGQCDQTGCTTIVTDADIAASVAIARMVDVVVVNVAVTSTEGYDRDNLTLGAAQDALITQVAAVNPNTIVVVRCPGAILMPWASQVQAIIVQFLPGEASGAALAATLFGDADPSGRLPLSFPAEENSTWLSTASQYPGIEQPGTSDPRYIATYTEELLIGYRFFDAMHLAPAHAFGAGLSYTNFTWSDLHASSTSVQLTVTNVGGRKGVAVVQLYLGFPEVAGEPPQALRGFSKMVLKPTEAKVATFALTTKDRSVWDTAAAAWKEVTGDFKVYVGASSRDIKLTGSFTVPSSR